MIVKPNEQVVARGYVDEVQPYHQTCALLQAHHQANADLDLTPSLISYRHRDTEPAEVIFSNLATPTVTLNPKSVLCEVQPVTIASLDDVPTSVKDHLFSQIDLTSDILSTELLRTGEALIMEFEDIFSKNEDCRHEFDTGSTYTTMSLSSNGIV